MEKWKDIKGYEGLYRISDKGRVMSVARQIRTGKGALRIYGGKPRSLNTDGAGYRYVDLYKNGRARYVKVHRLVAEAFLSNPRNYKFVNHKNENKGDNRVENLEWCSAKYNRNYGTANERLAAKLSIKVEQLNLAGKHVATFESAKVAAKQFGNKNIAMQIGECCRGKQKTAHGFKWRYVK